MYIVFYIYTDNSLYILTPTYLGNLFIITAVVFSLCPLTVHAQENDLTNWQKPTANCTQEGIRQIRCDPTAVYIAQEPTRARLEGAGANLATVSGEDAQDYNHEYIFMITTIMESKGGPFFRGSEKGRAFVDGRETKIRLFNYDHVNRSGRHMEKLTWFISPKAINIASSAETFRFEFGGAEIGVITLLPQIREVLRRIGWRTEYDGSRQSGEGRGGARGQLNDLGVRYGKASFFDRIERGDRKVVELFLKSGMSANAINSEGKSALVIAVRSAEKDIVDLLLKAGANPNGRDRREEEEEWTDVKKLGNSPLQAAHWSYADASKSNKMLRARYLAIANLLLEEGADVDAEDKAGNTLLSSAAVMLQPELLNLYLDNGADVNHVGNGGETALTTVFGGPPQMGEEGKKEEVVRKLVDAGADVNHQNERGETALMMASKIEVVKLLLRYGADPNLKNNNGKTALRQTLESSVLFHDEGELEDKKALLLAKEGAYASTAAKYLMDEGHEDFARRLRAVANPGSP